MAETVQIRYMVPVLDSDYVRGIRRLEIAARIAEEDTWPEWNLG